MKSVKVALTRFCRGGFDWGSAETPHFSSDAEIHPLFSARVFFFRELIGDYYVHHIIARRKTSKFETSATFQSLRIRFRAGVDRFRLHLVEDLAVAIYLQLRGQLRLAGLRVWRGVIDERAVINHRVAGKATHAGRRLYVFALLRASWRAGWRVGRLFVGFPHRRGKDQSRKLQVVFTQVGNLNELAGRTHPPGLGVSDDSAELISAKLFDHEIVSVIEPPLQRHAMAPLVQPQLERAPVLFDHRAGFVERESGDLQLQHLLAVVGVFERQVRGVDVKKRADERDGFGVVLLFAIRVGRIEEKRGHLRRHIARSERREERREYLGLPRLRERLFRPVGVTYESASRSRLQSGTVYLQLD